MTPIHVTQNDPDLKYMYILDHVRYAYRHLRWQVIVKIAAQLNLDSIDITTKFENDRETVYIRYGKLLGELKPVITFNGSDYDLIYSFIPVVQ